MTARITERFAQVRSEKRAGLVTYVMAYDPDYATSLEILKGLPAAGADVIELGMPFSDPMADGPSIEAAGQRAQAAGATISGIFKMVKEFRQQDAVTPLVLMGYYNPLQSRGLERFSAEAAEVGVDGVLIVDLPPEEDAPLYQALADKGIALIKLVTPTTDEARLKTVLQRASGFIYYVSVAGITGTKSASLDSVEQALARFRKQTDLPIAVGFGIKTPEQAAAMGKLADAVVVGSALVQTVAEQPGQAPALVKAQVAKLAAALKH